MKHLITAATAAAIFGVPALASAAEAPIQLTLGAMLREFVIVSDQDQTGTEKFNAVSMSNLARVSISGKTTLDNGWKASAFVRFEAASRKTEGVDEAYIDLSHAQYGTIRAGEKEGFNAGFIGDPVPEALLTTDERIVGTQEMGIRNRNGISISDAFTFKRFASDTLSVQYKSPEFAVANGKLQGAVSLHPRLDVTTGAIDRFGAPSNALDVSGAYTYAFSEGGVKVAGGYIHVDSRTAPGGNDGLAAFNVHADAKFGAFTVGGTYMSVNPRNDLDQRLWSMGVLYTAKPWKFSADFSHYNRKATATATFRETVDLGKGQVAYRFGPGLELGVVGFVSNQRDATPARASWKALGGIMGVKIDI